MADIDFDPRKVMKKAEGLLSGDDPLPPIVSLRGMTFTAEKPKVFVLVTFDPEEGPTSLVSSVHGTIHGLVEHLLDAEWAEDRGQEVSEAVHAMVEAGEDTVHSPGPFLAFITHTAIT